MLEDFTIDTFRPRLGERFCLVAEPVLEVDLVEAETVGERAIEPSGRVPFSLVFRGPLDPVLPQRIYRFENDALGAFDLFIVPIGPDEAGMRYQAVFS
jgi:hypothetical protein